MKNNRKGMSKLLVFCIILGDILWMNALFY